MFPYAPARYAIELSRVVTILPILQHSLQVSLSTFFVCLVFVAKISILVLKILNTIYYYLLTS